MAANVIGDINSNAPAQHGANGSSIYKDEAATGAFYVLKFLTTGTLSAIAAASVDGLSKVLNESFDAGTEIGGIGEISAFTCTGIVQAFKL